MRLATPVRRESGAVLIVAMIMLVLITMMVAGAFTISNTNAKAVGNMQFRSESIAAANKALEQSIGSWNFSSVLPENDINVDIDNDGNNDYVVTVAAPVCLNASGIASVNDPGTGGTSVNLDGTISSPSPTYSKVFTVSWHMEATVRNTATGAQTTIHQGVSRVISQSDCNTVCAPSAGAICS